MLLTPQHFQQLCSRYEASLQYHALAIAPLLWGVRDVLIDQHSLPTGNLSILELEAVMPDGLIISHHARTDGNLQMDLIPHVDKLQRMPLAIHVAVPVGGLTAVGGDMPRYRSCDGEPVSDANGGQGAVSIPRLKPRLVLVFEDDLTPQQISFPLLKVHYQNGTFLQTSFVPPATVVPQSIKALCDNLAKRIREKAAYLAEQVLGSSWATGTTTDLQTRMRLQSLVAGLPVFEALITTISTHPYALYLAFCSLVGHLTCLGSSLVPPVLEAYNHNDLMSTFEALRDRVLFMISEGIPETYTSHVFKFQDGAYRLVFARDWLHRRLLIGIRGQSGMSEKDVIAWGKECLIGSSSVIDTLREKRIRGPHRQHIDHVEDLTPAGIVLFELSGSHDFIKPDEELLVLDSPSRPDALRPSEIILYVKRPQPE